MKKKFTEEEFFKQLTGILINYSVYIYETKGLQLGYDDIRNFQNWIIEKQKQHAQESIQLNRVNETQE